MRILLSGSGKGDDIAGFLKKSHILIDYIPQSEQALLALSENIYDAMIYLSADAKPEQQVHRLRADGIVLPILIAAAHASAHDRMHALDAGADDVMSRPFLLGELLARLRALCRRVSVPQATVLHTGDLTLDLHACLLSGPVDAMRLSARNMQLLELFLKHPGQTLLRETLRQKVWGIDCETSYNSLEVYLTLLRRKIHAVGSSAQIIAVRGLGYCFTPALPSS
ncbi:MAG: response regulator transcription factor [Agathobaculum sp.]|uniref:response regulator transcription factor n=1 Tax=Agathobaculum sp. TaxID=2048138 RepID=UPI003D8A6DCE